MIIKDYKIGEKVLVIRKREDFVQSETPKEHCVPNGWEGIVIKKGISADGLYYAYDLQGEDGRVITVPHDSRSRRAKRSDKEN